MPTFETILYEKRGKIVYVTLNRPHILNAFNDQMAEEINEAWFEFDADPEAHVAILSGAGRAFCSGADVRQRQLRPREELIRLGGPGGRNTRGGGLRETVNWKPVIAAIHGYAYGAGLALLTQACDLVVAAEGTRCQLTEVRRGLGGAGLWVSAWFWTGDRFANELAITGRVFTAEEALQHGMFNRVVPQDKLLSTAEELAEEILKNPPLSVRASVRMVRWYVGEMSRVAGLYSQGLKLHLTEDFREGATAFMEKREPVFHGR
ncbi:MAG: enoyl-CoA hydratase/isomerase family protein [Chloroflexi bacterium]|nr:enoyl-CoA hydratase/isomerase family protein [Chloroflexota bacterium]